MSKIVALPIVLLLSACGASPPPEVHPAQLPEPKRTSVGLYVTARQAYDMLRSDADARLIDVRTPEEYVFVGHATMALNVPLAFNGPWDPEKKAMKMEVNPDFAAQVRARVTPQETLLLMCRSGGRSAMAVEALAKAGFERVFNVVDGFEGDMAKPADSPELARRSVNGWKNAGLPWTYQLDPDLVHAEGAGAKR